MLHLADRIKNSLKAAGLSPRCLSAVTDVHHTTIYLILKKGESANPHPLVRKATTDALDKIDHLVHIKDLPFPSSMTHANKIKELTVLFAKYQ